MSSSSCGVGSCSSSSLTSSSSSESGNPRAACGARVAIRHGPYWSARFWKSDGRVVIGHRRISMVRVIASSIIVARRSRATSPKAMRTFFTILRYFFALSSRSFTLTASQCRSWQREKEVLPTGTMIGESATQAADRPAALTPERSNSVHNPSPTLSGAATRSGGYRGRAQIDISAVPIHGHVASAEESSAGKSPTHEVLWNQAGSSNASTQSSPEVFSRGPFSALAVCRRVL
jgi:hypothetical protein